MCSIDILTSAFTYTTASGALFIATLPYTPQTLSLGNGGGTVAMRGYTKANFTQLTVYAINAVARCRVFASGSAQTPAALTTADVPTGGTVQLVGMFEYEV